MKKAIKAITNVIEPEPGSKYLLVFKADDPDEQQKIGLLANQLIQGLRAKGIAGFDIALRNGQDLKVIEAA